MAPPRFIANLRRGATFLAGLGFAAIPTVAPFLAVLSVLTGRLELQRADVLWWISAFLLGLPMFLTGYPLEGALSIAQVIAVWLIFRSATKLRQGFSNTTAPGDIGAGLVVGLALTLALGLRQVSGLNFEAAQTTLDAIVWKTHPALFAHAILVLSAILALVVPSPRLRTVSLLLGAIGIVVTGSREASWAWLFIAIGFQFVARRGTRFTRLAEWGLIGFMVLILSGLPSLVGIGRIGFLTDFGPEAQTANMFRGTEAPVGDWWFPLGIAYRAEPMTVEGAERVGFAVTKEWTESWSRLQQAVTLEPGETYTLSAVLDKSDGTRPGFDGWGRSSVDVPAANLATTLTEDGHRGTASGPMSVLSTSSIPLESGHLRLVVTFRYEGEEPLTWYVGVVPDRSNRTGVTASFAEFQLTPSYTLLPYVPAPAERGVTDLRTSRFPIWRDALEAIGARPLLGWGPNGFPTAVGTLRPDETLLRPVAAHAHNALFSALVNRGLLGALGLAGLLVLLALRAVQQRDRAAVIVLGGVLLMNMFDSTILSGAVIYPLAAVLGWRAVGHRRTARTETGVGSALAVRIALGFSDFLTGVFALSLGIIVAGRFEPAITLGEGWTVPLLYAALTWPAVAASARLYPGYGRPSFLELSYTIRSAVGAGVLVGFIALLVPDVFGLTAPVFVVAVLASAFLAPALRSATKVLLRRLRLWGRPVMLLGTEPAAARIVKHLLANPGIGLHPVAVFGSNHSWDVAGLPVSGPIEQAWDAIDNLGIRHVIVTRSAANHAAFDTVLLQTGNQLKYVQYLPDLHGLPTNSVVATPLGTALALEARNQLASETNRIVKRVIDVAGSLLLLALLSGPLVAIAILIRLDSAGSPLYLSPRIGRFGRTFYCIKFRTMHVDAEERLHSLLSENPSLKQEYERYHKLEDDPRVTRVGRLLRRLSLDELPQLLNVLLGQMSLVGPRPYLARERDLMGAERDLIFLARPGMTGYWQIEARNDVTFEERQSMEAHYVRNWSVWWDIDILLRTPGVMVGKTGK